MTQQQIPVVAGGTIQLDDETAFELESTEGSQWLKSAATSFRYESTCGNRSFTARKQPVRGIDYWYGSRKVAGKLHKKYIGKVSDLTVARLESVAEELSNPTPKSVVDGDTQTVADREAKAVGDNAPNSRIDALEARLQRMEELLGKVPA